MENLLQYMFTALVKLKKKFLWKATFNFFFFIFLQY